MSKGVVVKNVYEEMKTSVDPILSTELYNASSGFRDQLGHPCVTSPQSSTKKKRKRKGNNIYSYNDSRPSISDQKTACQF